MPGHREKHGLNVPQCKFPSTHEEWSNISDHFERRWNFPGCVGAIDGKHVVIQPPANYYNYKHNNSIVLLAVAGPNYECVYADVGTNGRISDGGVWNKCSLSRGLEDGSVSFHLSVCHLEWLNSLLFLLAMMPLL